jgi:hypothetical protein
MILNNHSNFGSPKVYIAEWLCLVHPSCHPIKFVAGLTSKRLPFPELMEFNPWLANGKTVT